LSEIIAKALERTISTWSIKIICLCQGEKYSSQQSPAQIYSDQDKAMKSFLQALLLCSGLERERGILLEKGEEAF